MLFPEKTRCSMFVNHKIKYSPKSPVLLIVKPKSCKEATCELLNYQYRAELCLNFVDGSNVHLNGLNFIIESPVFLQYITINAAIFNKFASTSS